MSTTTPANPWTTWRRQRWVLAVALLVIALVVALLVTLLDQEPGAAKATLPQIVTKAGTLTQRPCAVGASRPFVPTRVVVPRVIRSAPVLALPRDANGVPGVAPISVAGMHEFSWDRGPVGILPGTKKGNALFNAHTWPWPAGGALGNAMLLGLHKGMVIVLHGRGVTQCYRVTKRVQVPAVSNYAGYWSRTGPPQIAIIVCSGVRAGPGDWLSRTIWFASPITSSSITF